MAPRMAVATSLEHLTPKPTSIVVADGNEGLKAGTLTGTGLFLNGHDFEDFVFQRGSQKEIDDFEFFDGEREEIDFLQTLNSAIFNETSKFGDGNPFFLVFAASTTTTTAASTTTIKEFEI